MILAMAIMAFLLVFIVPKFEQIFHDMLGDKPLPAITLFVIGDEQVRQESLADPDRRDRRYRRRLTNSSPARAAAVRLIDRIKLRVPLFGDLIRKTAISRFSRTLGTLVTSGVPILQALNITRETAGNTVIAQRHLAGARQRQGRRIDRAAAGSERRLSADGHQHDRRRRRDRPVARDAFEDRRSLR